MNAGMHDDAILWEGKPEGGLLFWQRSLTLLAIPDWDRDSGRGRSWTCSRRGSASCPRGMCGRMWPPPRRLA